MAFFDFMTKKTVTHPRLIQIIWPGADWETVIPMVDKGLLPNLSNLINKGVIGKVLSVQPDTPSSIWTSAVTGKYPHKHGIVSEVEPSKDNETLFAPVTRFSRTSKAIWNILDSQGIKSIVVNVPATHPAEAIEGVIVTPAFNKAKGHSKLNWPLNSGAVSPSQLDSLLAELRVHPEEISGLDLSIFVPLLLENNQVNDPRLSRLAQYVAETASIQAAATDLIENENWEFACIHYSPFAKISQDFINYAAPKLPFIKDDDFAMYRQVIKGNYIFHDMMLGRLIDLAGENCHFILLSEAGIHSGDKRTNETAEKNSENIEPGLLVASGPSFKEDHMIYGASIIDFVPTIMHVFDLPLCQDIDGSVLKELFKDATTPHETVARESNNKNINSSTSYDLYDPPLEKYLALNTRTVNAAEIDLSIPDMEGEKNRDFLYGFVLSLMAANQEGEAIPILNFLMEADPTESKYQYKLMNCYIAIGEPILAFESVAKMFKSKKHYAPQAYAAWKKLEDKGNSALNPLEKAWKERLWKKSRVNLSGMAFLNAYTLFACKEFEQALSAANKADFSLVNNPASLLNLRAECLRKLDRIDETPEIYQQMLALNESDFNADIGLARAYYDMEKFSESANYAKRAIGKRYFNPQAHYLYAGALFRCGLPQKSAKALKQTIIQDPAMKGAYQRLILLYSGVLNSPMQVEFYKNKLREINAQTGKKQKDRAKGFDKNYVVLSGDSP